MPTTLDDRYQLDELIGVGAAGRVYRARDLRLGRTVAVKRLRSDALGGDDARARFEREALALARVSDPHVLPVFDVSAAADDAYLVTAFCADGTLAERLETRVLTCPEVRELVHDVAAGLVAMHGAGIIHRDIKPRNILRLEGRWVIGDLGIARVEGDTSLTQTGAVIGTPDYWAPETARGSAPTPAVDVYGLGCVAFEALAGRPPFRGATPLETGLLHATAATPTLPDGVEERDPALAALVIRMLDKDPADRPMPDELACERPGPAACSDTLVYPDLPTVAITQPRLAACAAHVRSAGGRRGARPRSTRAERPSRGVSLDRPPAHNAGDHQSEAGLQHGVALDAVRAARHRPERRVRNSRARGEGPGDRGGRNGSVSGAAGVDHGSEPRAEPSGHRRRDDSRHGQRRPATGDPHLGRYTEAGPREAWQGEEAWSGPGQAGSREEVARVTHVPLTIRRYLPILDRWLDGSPEHCCRSRPRSSRWRSRSPVPDRARSTASASPGACASKRVRGR
jgi:eukaryotic-like serine/threonine-protein kinase